MLPVPFSSYAFIALGSNMGDRGRLLEEAIERLRTFSAAALLISSLRETAPVDCPPGSPPFLNGVIGMVPSVVEAPESLLRRLQELEQAFGRPPKQVMNEPRPLDLDLITFRGEIRQTTALVLPHPRAMQRRFVLEPLAEIAPGLVLPGERVSVNEQLRRL